MKYQQAPLSYIRQYYEADVGETETPESRFYQRYLKKVKGDSVLSVACGPQLYDDLAFFGKKPKEYVGLDINKNTVRFLKTSKNAHLLKNKKAAKGVRVKALVGDVLKYDPRFKDRFDCVIAVAVLGMFPKNDFRRAIKNIRSYLKPGGTFLDIDWTDSNLTKEIYAEKEKYRFYTRKGPRVKDQESLIRASRFRIVGYDEIWPDKRTYQWGKIFVYVAKANKQITQENAKN